MTGCRAQANKFYIKSDNVKSALLYAQSALRRWTELYAKLQNECGDAISRKLDYNLPPVDHLRALEAIADALSAQSESERTDGRPFGGCLATAVLQSDLYRMLDTDARAECDELIERWKGWLKHG